MDLFARIAELRARGERAVLVTVVDTHGSTPRKPGARMVVFPNGRTMGTIGGGTVEHRVKEAAAEVMRTGVPQLVHHQLTAELAMCCGGQMTFFVEPVMDQPHLVVMGAGHVGRAILRAAAPLDFRLVAVDDLPEHLEHADLPAVAQRVDSYEPEDLEALPFGPHTFLVIATREHRIDQKLLEMCLRKEFAYLGVIGSKRKALLQRKRLAAKGYDEALIDKVRCPMGVPLPGETPEEIAISVCAELIQVRRGGGSPPAQ